MKNLLTLSILLVILMTPFTFVSAESEGGGTRYIIILDNNRGEIERSLLPPVEASLELDMQSLEIVFNKSLGNVSIVIANDMGQTVGGATCNTSLESVKYISVPTDTGSYTIIISGNDYEGEGCYNIMDDSSNF